MIQTKIGKLLFLSRLALRTVSSRPIPRMSDAIVPGQAIKFTTSGQWEYEAPASYDSKESYSPDRLSTSLSLITWNVDFMKPNVTKRLTAALDYLQYHAFPGSQGGQPPPCVILLQEIHVGEFDTLLAHPWVREWFMVAPGSTENGWPRYATYGTVTLVSRSDSLLLAGSTCVHFGGSRMWRNALVTDVVLGVASRARVLRVVNTHLESLPQGTPQRVVQMGVIASLLKKEGILGGIVGGDMNAIAASDETLAEENGLADAWEEDKRNGNAEDGITWGYQPRMRFPPGRLDRILYTKKDGLKVRDVRRIAVGLEIPGTGWVSDHYGLACQVEAPEEAEL
jgi:tyrosyl-DNA phosphodiesterase 2